MSDEQTQPEGFASYEDALRYALKVQAEEFAKLMPKPNQVAIDREYYESLQRTAEERRVKGVEQRRLIDFQAMQIQELQAQVSDLESRLRQATHDAQVAHVTSAPEPQRNTLLLKRLERYSKDVSSFAFGGVMRYCRGSDLTWEEFLDAVFDDKPYSRDSILAWRGVGERSAAEWRHALRFARRGAFPSPVVPLDACLASASFAWDAKVYGVEVP